MFSSLEEVGERLRATGYIADSIAATTVYLAAKLQKPLLLKAQRAAARRNSHMRLPTPQIQASNGSSAMKASMTQSRHPDFYRGSESEEPVVGASEVLGFRKTFG